MPMSPVYPRYLLLYHVLECSVLIVFMHFNKTSGDRFLYPLETSSNSLGDESMSSRLSQYKRQPRYG
jgi:hypothetical protein